MISIEMYDRRKAFEPHKTEDEDWNTLIEFEEDVWCQDVYDRHMARFATDEHKNDSKTDPEFDERYAKLDATVWRLPCLKQEVIDWLNENVADDPKPYDDQVANGWCMGNDSYRGKGSLMDVSLFFYRRRDALAFVKRWSVHKKCTTYFDYFKEIRKELIDGKLVRIDY
jgi:hypothetical protein